MARRFATRRPTGGQRWLESLGRPSASAVPAIWLALWYAQSRS
jgi:hypothetical protein